MLFYFRYGILEGKELAKKTPLQWSIFRDNFVPEEGFQSGLDEEIFDIASNAPNSSDSVMVKPLQDLRGNVVAAVLESISIKPRYSIYQSSIESIIQLAQDLAIDSKISGEVPKDNQDRRSDIPNSHRNTPTPLVSSIENKSRVDVMETAPQAPLKRNPFVSAKEQFGKEVSYPDYSLCLFDVTLIGWETQCSNRKGWTIELITGEINV